jgi:AraC-like DNA-binding protein
VGTPVGPAIEERALDVLSDVLRLIRLRGEILCRSELSSPWGLGFECQQSYFHVVERGTCVLQLAGVARTVQLAAGDLVLLPHGHSHRVMDAAGSRVVAVSRLVGPERKGPASTLRWGGGGAATDLLCGTFRFDEPLPASVLNGLPKTIHLTGSRGRVPNWLRLTMRALMAEAKSTAPGREIAIARLLDVLFVQTIRHWLATDPDKPPGWITALSDPRIGAALASLHARPAHAWDVEALALEVGMSRSSFAQRFVELLGEPPSRYLARWRMHLAAQWLQAPGMTIAQVAERVGYESEAAFSRAFKRYLRVPPSVFRERSRRQSRRGSAARK